MSCRVMWNGAPAKYAKRTTQQTRRSGVPLMTEKLQVRERRWSKAQAGNRSINRKTAKFERNQPGARRRSWSVNADNWPTRRPGCGKRPTKSGTSNRKNLTWERTKMGFPTGGGRQPTNDSAPGATPSHRTTRPQLTRCEERFVDSSMIHSARAQACTRDILNSMGPLPGTVGRFGRNVNRTDRLWRPTNSSDALPMAIFG
jgi:hypothetical protein